MNRDDENNPYRSSYEPSGTNDRWSSAGQDEPQDQWSPSGRAPRAAGGVNVLGIVGLVLFFVPVVGLVISIIALFHPKKAIAVVGVLLGLVGTGCVGSIAIGMVFFGPQVFMMAELSIDTERIESGLSQTSPYPADLSGLALPSDALTDPWGNAYLYVAADDGSSWALTSLGQDGALGTPDDIVLTSEMSENERRAVIEGWFEQAIEDRFDTP